MMRPTNLKTEPRNQNKVGTIFVTVKSILTLVIVCIAAASNAGYAAENSSSTSATSGSGASHSKTKVSAPDASKPNTTEPSASVVPSFRRDVMPVFFRAGCNAGTCHGSARGKDGYMLSLFGYDTAGDYFRTVEEIPGRRVNSALPSESLLLLKATGAVPHTGGKLFERDSDLANTLRNWIRAGAPDDVGDVPDVAGIAVSQPSLVFDKAGKSMDLRVTATYADGSTRDVTDLALFGTNNPSVADIDSEGGVTAKGPGDTTVFARFSRFTVGAEVIVLPPSEGFAWPNPPENNFIDGHVFARLQKLRIAPSELCDDETFLRRVTLDLAARPPTVQEYEAFMADTSTDKRSRKIDALLASEDFTDYLTALWGELCRINSHDYTGRGDSHKPANAFNAWLRHQVAEDRPFDEVVADMATAVGSTNVDGQTGLYTMLIKDYQLDPKVLAADFSQLFLGVRMQCAECHNHPFDRWTMDDYYGFVSFFSCVKRKSGSDSRDRRVIFDPSAPPAKHALDGRLMPAKLLGEVEPVGGEGDPRRALAAWIKDPANDLFNRNIVNRLWAHLFGVGIVDPIDDFRATNPPANGPLLDALAERFVKHGRRIRPIVRDICNSRVYQLSIEPTPSGRDDQRQFSHAQLRRLRADVLLDSIVAVTGVPRSLPRAPTGTKAINYINRNHNLATGDFVLDTFGQSPRKTVCACDTRTEPSLSQVMHLLVGDTSGPSVHKAATKDGVLKSIVESESTPEGVIEAIFIRVLSRRPTKDELETMLQIVADGQAPAVYEDIFAGLIDSSEFLFNH
ncbi:Ig-like domain (group 2) [Neorhodopirellula lusitana]|uniref:Ig-like domain (Group 2) n=1 Tax=Neorhodopirellula lusitana TaxID=445327 RepID=A0ABY1QAG4_9BACT|nr:Ig-like domain (group 2) [Neorhodopirellula lusitana]